MTSSDENYSSDSSVEEVIPPKRRRDSVESKKDEIYSKIGNEYLQKTKGTKKSGAIFLMTSGRIGEGWDPKQNNFSNEWESLSDLGKDVMKNNDMMSKLVDNEHFHRFREKLNKLLKHESKYHVIYGIIVLSFNPCHSNHNYIYGLIR